MSLPGPSDIIVGIDLGTTNSCVAYYHNNSAETIEDPTGAYTVPSIVSFTPHERHIGRAAAPQRETNAENLLFGIKRLIGHELNDPTLQKDLQNWPFRIQADPQNPSRPVCVVDYLGKERQFAPEEVSAMVLSHIKDYASTRIGQAVHHCVITVPAYFNDAQRTATKNAGTIAGWNVVRVINEPTAAAFDYAYGELSRDPSFDKTILIFDLGGGTFDVSILRLYQGMVKTLATCGDSHFGGEDFDNLLCDYLLDIVNKAASAELGSPFDLRSKVNKYARLRQEAVRAKEALASCERTMINLQDIHAACQNIELTRAVMDKLCKPLYDQVLPLVEKAISDSGLSRDHIDDVVLVGGSSRLQKVREIVRDFFPDGKLRTLVANPDQSIARGAAIVGASFSQNQLQQVSGIQIKDIISHSIGVLKARKQIEVIVPKHTSYPCSIVHHVTKREGADSLVITLYEGEETTAGANGKNTKLGVLRLDGLDPEADDYQYEINVEIDDNGIIIVTARDPSTGKQQVTQFNNGDLQTGDIEAKRKRFIEFETESENYKKWSIMRGEIIERVSAPNEILESLGGDYSTVAEEFHVLIPHFIELVGRLKECETLGIEYQEYFQQLCEHIPQYEPLMNCLSSLESFDDFDF
jgi:L1 cell adhesion molecule like protein